MIYISLRFFTDGLEELLILLTAWYYMKYLHKSYIFLGLTLASYSVGTLFFAPFVGALDVKLQSSSKTIIIFGRAVARTLIGGCLFIYSGFARLTSFEINFISKKSSQAELEYMNIHPPPPQLTL